MLGDFWGLACIFLLVFTGAVWWSKVTGPVIGPLIPALLDRGKPHMSWRTSGWRVTMLARACKLIVKYYAAQQVVFFP